MPTHSTQTLDVTAHVASSIVPAVLDVLGQRWSLAIIQALQLTGRSFGQLLQELKIPRSTLSARLKHLQLMRCIQTSPAGYRLSESGQALLPVVSLVWAWDHPVASAASAAPFVHSCGKWLAPVLVCKCCAESVRAGDIRLGAAGERPLLQNLPKPLRRSRAEFSAGAALTAAEILGDRWTAMIVALGFFGVQRYSELARYLAIAPNILADRLQRLCEGGVLLHEGPHYRFSARGRQLFPLIVALMMWGDRWLRASGQTPSPLLHLPCGQLLQPELRCSCCGKVADQRSIHAADGHPANQVAPGSA